ncbi:putative cyclin [Rosa chinensis]|uniref:B-like cyclin n=1 Tax=Rosa chinensis TaxID=74649 RepID=A0A2P6R3L7_ROSCH|nr:cyclin-SDS [Rosa chinensis]PRQ41018.1 putative cyclin [Rosa chinensis]
MKFRSIRAIQSLEMAPARLKTTKKLRSELPRRRRTQISPILYSSQKPNARCSEASGFSVNSYFGGEISCESSRVSVGSESEVRSSLKKRSFGETEAPSRKVTRSSYGGKAVKIPAAGDGEVEASESSCVESNSGADFGGFVERKLKLKTKSGIAKVMGGSEAVTESAISESDKVSLKFKEQEVISLNSGLQLCSEATVSESKTAKDGGNRAPEFEFHGASSNYFGENFAVSNSESTIEQRPQSFGLDSDFACTEQFCYDDGSEYSSSQTLSDFQSDPFQENSEIEFSDYTPSFFTDSGSQFSQGSVGDSPSPTFALLLKYREKFSRSVTALDLNAAPRVNEAYKHESTFLKFGDDEVEESYQMLRNRERLKVFLRDYTEDYSSTTEYGGLILQQRSYMVRWIIEISTATGLQQETKFLGVNLLDRFLSKGFFKSKRILQIVGIACLTLATRIEENQPYNSVREKSFYVGSNLYSRCEVVAMEWLVLEVLNFQCFLPTIYNFLWFYLKAAEADEEVETRAKYLAGLQLSDPVQLCYWPSTVAAALVILASLQGNDASPQQVLDTHVRTDGDDLHECIESLERFLRRLIAC